MGAAVSLSGRPALALFISASAIECRFLLSLIPRTFCVHLVHPAHFLHLSSINREIAPRKMDSLHALQNYINTFSFHELGAANSFYVPLIGTSISLVHNRGAMNFWVDVFYFSKYYEMLDTVLLVL